MGMKTVRRIIVRVVDFFFNLILPVDEEMESLRTKSACDIFSRLRRVSDQKYDGIFAIFSYQDKLVRKMIWQMKFRECRWVAEIFGRFLAVFILQRVASAPDKTSRGTGFINAKQVILIPTPLHPKRFAERGYNQCEWLCEEIMKNLDEASCERIKYNKKILARIKYRTKQSWSSRAERLENSSGIFAVRNVADVVGRTFILIDDVVTTGATLNEARRTLLAAGASNVICFVVAH